MLIGYARVATADQSLELQRDALQAASCERLFTDVARGAQAERPGLTAALQACGPGDVLVVWKLDRLGRSPPDLVAIMGDLLDRGIGFRSLDERLDTTQDGGEHFAHLLAALAACERDRIHERSEAGRAAARARGRHGGRPPGVADEQKRQAALALKQDGTHSVKDICQLVGISRNTYYRYLRTAPPAHPDDPSAADPEPALPTRQPETPAASPSTPRPRVMKVQVWMQVENNNKFVRGKEKARAEIERWVLSRYGMDPAEEGGPEYVLTMPYTTDEELDRIIYDEIWGEAQSLADLRHCFIEGDIVSLEDPERSW